jgi:N-methylhydantoinase A
MARYRVTVDTGGTFSDFVYLNEETGELSIAKLPSTPEDPSRAISAGIEELFATRARRDRLFLPRHHGRDQRAA